MSSKNNGFKRLRSSKGFKQHCHVCFQHQLFHSVVISRHNKFQWQFPLGSHFKVQKKTEETLLQMIHHYILPLKTQPRNTLPLLGIQLPPKDKPAGLQPAVLKGHTTPVVNPQTSPLNVRTSRASRPQSFKVLM